MDKYITSTGKDDWETPHDFFKELNEEFNFTLDPCCTNETAKCIKHYTPKENGLIQDWNGEVVYCNPPYSRKHQRKWIEKCYNESKHATIVMLLPARTDTIAFHKYIYGKAEIRFIKGRLKFVGANSSAPFPSMIVIFRQNKELYLESEN